MVFKSLNGLAPENLNSKSPKLVNLFVTASQPTLLRQAERS